MSFKTLAEYVDLDIDHPVCNGLAELDFDNPMVKELCFTLKKLCSMETIFLDLCVGPGTSFAFRVCCNPTPYK